MLKFCSQFCIDLMLLKFFRGTCPIQLKVSPTTHPPLVIMISNSYCRAYLCWPAEPFANLKPSCTFPCIECTEQQALLSQCTVL